METIITEEKITGEEIKIVATVQCDSEEELQESIAAFEKIARRHDENLQYLKSFFGTDRKFFSGTYIRSKKAPAE